MDVFNLLHPFCEVGCSTDVSFAPLPFRLVDDTLSRASARARRLIVEREEPSSAEGLLPVQTT